MDSCKHSLGRGLLGSELVENRSHQRNRCIIVIYTSTCTDWWKGYVIDYASTSVCFVNGCGSDCTCTASSDSFVGTRGSTTA